MKTAVIDIGSNSVRYALYTPQTDLAAKELDSTVLADGLFFSGKLSDAAMARTVKAVTAFCRKAEYCGADEICIFATEAVRAATNGKTFTDAVRAACGVPVDVIDGATEARIGFLGAQPDAQTAVGVFDIGGASCETVCGKGADITYAASAPIGCVRLRDAAAGNRAIAERLIAQSLPDSLPRVETVTGIGGTATALGGMLYCPQTYDPVEVHNGRVPAAFLQETANAFFAGEDFTRTYPSLSPARARIIGYGALAALRLLRLWGKTEFTVSERDNMEGYYRLHAQTHGKCEKN